jgi:hypothetical protein
VWAITGTTSWSREEFVPKKGEGQMLVTSRNQASRSVADLVKFIRYNGPELTIGALRDWCRFTGTGTKLLRGRP